MLILPPSVFSDELGTIDFEWFVAAPSDNFSTPCDPDEELENLPVITPLQKILKNHKKGLKILEESITAKLLILATLIREYKFKQKNPQPSTLDISNTP